MLSKDSKQYISAALIILVAVVVFSPELINFSEKYYFRDFHHCVYPMKHYLSETIKNGQIPWWNPDVMCGTPFMANVQSGVFYPPNILFYFLPFAFALNVFIYLHIFLAGFFMYIFLKSREHTSELSLFGAVIFAFSGINISLINLLPALQAAVWTPLVVMMWLRFVQKRDISYLIFTSIVVTLQFFAGAPVILISTVVFAFLYGFVLKKWSSAKYSVSFLWMGSISLMLSAVQILPMLQMAQNSTRMVIKAPLKWSFKLSSVYDFITPKVFFPDGGISEVCFPQTAGEMPWLISVYLGFFVICLIIYRIISTGKRKEIFFLLASSAVFFILSLGENVYVVKKLLTLEIFNNLFKIPEKFICILLFIISIVTVEGLRTYITDLKRRWVLAFLVGLSVFLLSGLIILTKNNYLSFLGDLQSSVLSEMFLKNTQLIILLNLFNLFLIILFRFGMLKSRMFTALLCFSLFWEYSIINGKVNPTVPDDFYTSKPAITRYLHDNEGCNYRIQYCLNNDNVPHEPLAMHLSFQSIMVPNTNTAFDYQSSSGSEAIELAKPAFLSYLAGRIDNMDRKINLLKNMNCKYLVSGENLEHKDLRLVARIGVWQLYSVADLVPRVFVTGKARKIPLENLVREFTDIDIRNELLVSEEESITLKEYVQDSQGKVGIVNYEQDKVVIKTTLANPGYLVLLDAYYPGWEASVNGKKTDIIKAYEVFRAVEVGSGESEIIFQYRENKFIMGLVISFLGVFLSLLCMFLKRFIVF